MTEVQPTPADGARPHPAVRPITAGDTTPVSAMIARAFFDDPVMMYLFPDDDARQRKLPPLFMLYLKMGIAHRTCFMSGGVETAALWRPPNKWHIPFWQFILHGPAFASIFGLNALSVMHTLDAVEKQHPKAPHWYLQVLGTDPPKQGQGFAGTVVRKTLAVADEAHLPCYLESSKETNIPVYRSFGFEVTGEIRLPDGPPVWPMWREAR